LGDVYSVWGTLLYKNNTSLGTVDGTNGVYQWSSTLGATPRLVLGNGVNAYTYDSTTFAVIPDADFPAAFYKGTVYLDATTYVFYTPNNIQGSDLNDPTAWDALNVIKAQISSSRGIGLAKQLVYVVAFKEWDTEIFYDAANSPGSPLSPVQGAKINYGCASINTVQDIDGVLLWVCTNRNTSSQVMAMDNLKPNIVSTPAVDRLLDGVDFTAAYSWSFKEGGHSFYGLTFAAAADNLTLVYDLKERMWAQWTDTSGNYFPMVSATYNSSNQHLFQHISDGRMYLCDFSYTDDNTSLFTVDMYTPNFDGGTRRRKQLNMMTFITDQVEGSVMQVRNNDHDFVSTKWTNFRSVDLSKRNPFLSGCGTFQKRAYNFRHRANTKFRIGGIEMQMDLGTL
jgi:hypothetical protein